MEEQLNAKTPETQTAESRPEDGGSTPLPASTEEHTARMSRVLDLMASALSKDDHLRANLGSMNAGLMRLGIHFEEGLEGSMTASPLTVERLQKILPAVETHLRLLRQIDRFAHLEQQLTRSQRPQEFANHSENAAATPRGSEDWAS